MGGTIDGEVYRGLDFEGLQELQRKTNQKIVPLSAEEADLAELIEDKEFRAKVFFEKEQSGKDLVETMKDWLNKHKENNK